MSQLLNISTRKLFSLNDYGFNQYNNVLKHLLPKPVLNKTKAKPLTELKFGEVLTIRRHLTEPTLENVITVFNMVFNIEPKRFYKIKVVDFYHALNWIQSQMIGIAERELKQLNSQPDEKLKNAGVDELTKFGELNTLIALGEKFGKAPNEIADWTYSLVFSLMLHQKVSSEINERYIKQLNPKK